MKNLIFVVIALFMLNNCGYTPIYSSKNNNFYIDISQKDKSKLNSRIKNNIKTKISLTFRKKEIIFLYNKFAVRFLLIF